MKKIIALLLIALMCISVASCGAGDSQTDNKDSQPATGQVDNETGKNETNTDEPGFVAVEITLDNWQDYFEIIQRAEIVRNSFGDIESGSVCTVLVLKEEYVDCVIEPYEYGFSVEYNYSDIVCSVEYDITTDKYTLTTLNEDAIAGKGYKIQNEIQTTMRDFPINQLTWDKDKGGFYFVNSLDSQGSPVGNSFVVGENSIVWDAHYPDVEITRIKGSFVIVK